MVVGGDGGTVTIVTWGACVVVVVGGGARVVVVVAGAATGMPHTRVMVPIPYRFARRSGEWPTRSA